MSKLTHTRVHTHTWMLALPLKDRDLLEATDAKQSIKNITLYLCEQEVA